MTRSVLLCWKNFKLRIFTLSNFILNFVGLYSIINTEFTLYLNSLFIIKILSNINWFFLFEINNLQAYDQLLEETVGLFKNKE